MSLSAEGWISDSEAVRETRGMDFEDVVRRRVHDEELLEEVAS